MTENSKMPSKKLLTWLIVLLIALGISTYLQWDNSPEIPKMTPEVQKEAMATVDKMMELGKKHRWKEFNKLWVTVPSKQTTSYAKKLLGNFRKMPEIVNISFSDEQGKTIQILFTEDTGNMSVLTLADKTGTWCIEKIQTL